MSKIDRRRFLTLAGMGSVAAVAGAGPNATRLLASSGSAFTFRAVAGLPAKPLPAYASYVLEGHVDLAKHTGFLTTSLIAGDPGSMSTVALPGLSRVVRVTDVQGRGSIVRIRGVVDDRSQLMQGERSNVEVRINRSRGTVVTHFLGEAIKLQLAK
jgi:hypothetical protein